MKYIEIVIVCVIEENGNSEVVFIIFVYKPKKYINKFD